MFAFLLNNIIVFIFFLHFTITICLLLLFFTLSFDSWYEEFRLIILLEMDHQPKVVIKTISKWTRKTRIGLASFCNFFKKINLASLVLPILMKSQYPHLGKEWNWMMHLYRDQRLFAYARYIHFLLLVATILLFILQISSLLKLQDPQNWSQVLTDISPVLAGHFFSIVSQTGVGWRKQEESA